MLGLRGQHPFLFAFWRSDCGRRSAARKVTACAALRAQGFAKLFPAARCAHWENFCARTLHSTALMPGPKHPVPEGKPNGWQRPQNRKVLR